MGVALAVFGVVVWAGDNLEGVGGDGGEGGRVLGIVLSAAVVAAGYSLVVRVAQGPLAAAGVAASALGVPVLMGFVTYDPDQGLGVLTGMPFSVNAVVIVSLGAWAVSYLVVSATRGRVLYLTLGLAVLWPYIVDQVEDGAFGYLLLFPFSGIAVVFAGIFDEGAAVDFTTIGAVSLLFGAAYYIVALVLDRWERRGMATPFCSLGFWATAIGIGHLVEELEGIGTGFLLIAAGTVLAVYGALEGRRFTTWAWAAGIGTGVVAILADIFDDSATGGGIGLIVLGVALVVAAHWLLHEKLREPDEMNPGPSTLGHPAPPQPF